MSISSNEGVKYLNGTFSGKVLLNDDSITTTGVNIEKLATSNFL